MTTPTIVASWVRAAWLEVLDAVAQGCPAPVTVSIAPQDRAAASVTLRLVGHVQEWAAFLGLSAPDRFVCLSLDGTQRLTSTNSSGRIGNGTYVTVYHLHVEPITDPTTPASGPTAGQGMAGGSDA